MLNSFIMIIHTNKDGEDKFTYKKLADQIKNLGHIVESMHQSIEARSSTDTEQKQSLIDIKEQLELFRQELNRINHNQQIFTKQLMEMQRTLNGLAQRTADSYIPITTGA